MITKIDKITLYVDSQDEAKKFWTECLDFVVTIEEPMGPDGKWIEVSPKGANLTTFVLYPKQLMLEQCPENIAHPSIMFQVKDIEDLWGKLQEKGVETSEIQDYTSGKMFDFRDNEGNPYMVKE